MKVPADGLTIRISSGTGVGLTRLAAFDAALIMAGVGNFNLIRLSSVIPPGSKILEVDAAQQLPGEHGDRLYCVYAEAYATSPLEQAWAGIAWSRREDGSGHGLFVEHHGMSETAVEHDLRLSLAEMSRTRGGVFVESGMKVESEQCVDHPVCAVVIATYRRVSWASDE
jgi:arginine decarboxylase